MDESTDEGNHSQLSLICRIVEKSAGTTENRFLDLLNLSRCDAETIFRRVKSFLEDKNLDITRVGLNIHGMEVVRPCLENTMVLKPSLKK